MDEINLCRLCLANSQTIQILIGDEQMELILKKHNIVFEKRDLHNENRRDIIRSICLTCWTKVTEFDAFFIQIEQIHQMYVANELKQHDEPIIDDKINIIEPVCIINSIDTDDIEMHHINSDIENPIKMEPILKMEHTNSSRSSRHIRVLYSESDDSSEASSDSIPRKSSKRNLKKKIATNKANDTTKRRKKLTKVKDIPINDKSEEENLKLIIKYMRMRCEICRHEENFQSFTNCKNHYRDVHNQNGYVVCCSRKFRRIGRVIQHCMWHENPEAFKCSNCGKCFQDTIRLRDHITSMHVPNNERRFQCELCSRLFAKQHLLNTHLKVKHTEKEDRPYPCTEPNCDQRFVMPALLRFHVNKVHNLGDSRVCDICARFFKCSKSYERHYQVEHTNIDQRVQCDLCQKWFKHLDTLKEHLRRHKAARAQCKYCGRVSSNKKSLRLHIRNVHADIDSTVKQRNEYPCTICGKIFKKKQTLKEHVTLHTGEAFLYSCPFCPKTFRSSANMYAHRKRNHPKEYEEKFVQAKFHAVKMDGHLNPTNELLQSESTASGQL